VLVQISEITEFGMTFNDCDPLADYEAELNDVFAIQFYTSDTQQPDSPSTSDRVLILAVNTMHNKAPDNMAV